MATIQIKDAESILRTYTTDKVGFFDEEGNIVTFYANGGSGETETKAIDPNFSGGDITVTPSTGKTLSQVTIYKPINLVDYNVRSGTSIAGIYGSMQPAPNWCGKTEHYTWGRAYFNTAIDYATILPQLDYNNNSYLIGAVEKEYPYNSKDWVGLMSVRKLSATWYLLWGFYSVNNELITFPIYSTQAGTAVINEDGNTVTMEVTEGWNNTSIAMPYSSGAIIMSLPSSFGLDESMLTAGREFAFGDYKKPTGTLTITSNGTYDISGYANVVINVSGGSGSSVEGNTLITNGTLSEDGKTLTISGSLSPDGKTLILS